MTSKSINHFVFALALAIVGSVAQASDLPLQGEIPLQVIKMFDGTIATCQERADIGGRAWRPLSHEGVIKDDTLTITMKFETLRCDNVGGLLKFVPVAFGTRAVNPVGGYNEYIAYDVIGYTPNRRLNQTVAASINQAAQTVTFVGNVNQFPGLQPRNVARNGGRSAMLVTFLQGSARVGNAVTGETHPRILEWQFGAFGVFLSEQKGTLKVIP